MSIQTIAQEKLQQVFFELYNHRFVCLYDDEGEFVTLGELADQLVEVETTVFKAEVEV
jgi:hypothetical protein